jgi:Rab3 GTPase-activating protein catalytic subunit
MEAFKAANPGSTLGDFVRWYSPRDWIEEKVIDEDGNVQNLGELSQRMQIPGNMWLEVWQSARPVPARRQRRLFDDTKEAEKVLHWLASLTIADVALRLMPMLVHSAISRLTQHDECQLPLLQKLMSHIMSKATKSTRIANMDARRYEDLIRSISQAEVKITRAQSLLTKFSREMQHDGRQEGSEVSRAELRNFVSDLLEQPEVNVLGAARGPIGTIVHRLFITSQKHSSNMLPDDDEPSSNDHGPGRSRSAIWSGSLSSEFPQPFGKEYILRMMINRPAPWSQPSPQRMHCVLSKGEFRLAGAFTTDTNFQ